MSTTTQTRPLSEALKDAEAFRALFDGCYERMEIAGSLRRRKPQCADIEFVVIHRFGDVPDGTPGLFATTKRVSLLWHRLDQLVADRTVSKHIYSNGTKYGDKLRAVDWKGFNHELYSADVENWGAQLTIRTGPAEFSQRAVIGLQRNGYWNDQGYVWNKNSVTCTCGWHGRFVDLALCAESRFKNGYDQPVGCPICGHGRTLALYRMSVPDEQTYFKLCALKYVSPEDRR